MMGPAHLYKSPRWGLGKRANNQPIKFYLMIEAKNILVSLQWFFSWFLKQFLLELQRTLKLVLKRGVFSFNFCFIQALI